MTAKKYSVFIDGQSGTTGLQLFDRLKNHEHIELLHIAPEDRKNRAAKEALYKQADLVFLCLPDAAAKEAAQIALETNTRVIDASSVHRCVDGWVYGLPELNKTQREKIKTAQRVANPGCYATGALLILKPLVEKGVIKADTRVHINGISGYSGGGKEMISNYQESEQPPGFALYGVNFQHKHIPEVQKWSGLAHRPTFFPSVVNCEQGMQVLIAFDQDELNASTDSLAQLMADYYTGETYVRVTQTSDVQGRDFQYIEGLANTNYCDITVFASQEYNQVLFLAKLDNLGKGASGAAVQNMNVMLGLPESMNVAVAAE